MTGSRNLNDLSRAFAESAGELARALVDRLEAEDPELAEKVAQALAGGERLQLALEVAQGGAAIRLQAIDRGQMAKHILSIPAREARFH